MEWLLWRARWISTDSGSFLTVERAPNKDFLSFILALKLRGRMRERARNGKAVSSESQRREGIFKGPSAK